MEAVPDGLRHNNDGSSIVVAFYDQRAIDKGLAQEFRLSDGQVLSEWIVPARRAWTCPEFVEMEGKVLRGLHDRRRGHG